MLSVVASVAARQGRRRPGERSWRFLVSADEYHALLETVHLLPSPRNAERLRESLDDVRAGRLIEKDLVAE